MTKPGFFNFCLYIADDTFNSSQAVANLRAICDTYLPGRHNIEFVDVFRHPDRALEQQIFMTPTLIKLGPVPVERIVGNLSQKNLVLQALGLGAEIK